MKKLFTFSGAMLIMAGFSVQAQNSVCDVSAREFSSGEDVVNYVPSISLDSRFGYGYQFSGKSAGFGGDGLFLNVDGRISKHFTYSLCQRMFASNGDDDSVFGSTDWLTLGYEVGNFSFSAGKDALAVGSFEYDAYDLDSYFDMSSMFYNNIECWQWGLTAMWTNDSETSSFAFQAANSPFAFSPSSDNLYAYSLAWYGAWERYESIWSLNMFEYDGGRFVKCLALGNMFHFGDFSLGVDYMMRADRLKDIFNRDLTLTVAPAWEFGDRFRLFGRFGFEKSADDLPYDFTGEYLTAEERYAANDGCETLLPAFVTADKNYIFYGMGLEFFPLKTNKSIRLHAAWASNNYTGRHAINVGLTWKFDVVNAVRSIMRKTR